MTRLASDNAQEHAARSTSWAGKLVILTCAIPASMAMVTLAPVLPKMEAALAMSESDKILVKLTVGVVGIAMAVGSPLSGILADRMRRIRLIALATMATVGLGLVEYFIRDLAFLVGVRLCMALAASSVLTTGFALIGDIRDEKIRHRYAGLAISISTLSAFIALMISGILGDIDWRLTFLLFLVPLPFGILALFEDYKTRDVEQNHVSGKVQAVGEKVRFIFPTALVGLAIYIGIVQYIPLTYTAFRLKDLGVNSSTAVGISLTIPTLIATGLSGVYGMVRKRLSLVGVFALSFALLGVGSFGMALSGDFISAMGSQAIIGIAVGLISPNLLTAAGEAAESSTRGRIVGLVKGANLAGPLTGIIVAEPILRLGGTRGVFLVSATMALAAALLFVCGMIVRGRVSPGQARKANSS